LYWGPFWASNKFQDGYWENGVHSFVVFLSSINLGIKVLIFVIIYATDENVKQSMTVDGVKYGISTFCREN